MIQNRNKADLSLACIAFPAQPRSFILALSSTSFQALLCCSELDKASFRVLGKIFLSAIPEACCLALLPRRLPAPICAAFPCFAPTRQPSRSPWAAHAVQLSGRGGPSPLPQKLWLFRLELVGWGILQPCCWGPAFKQGGESGLLQKAKHLPVSHTRTMTIHGRW